MRTAYAKTIDEAPGIDVFEKLILEARKDEKMKPMIALMALIRHTLRPAEALGLRWEDWDEEKHGFHIRRQIKDVLGIGEQPTDILKTDGSKAFVRVSENLRPLIEITQGQSEWVVPNHNGKRWKSLSSYDRDFSTLKKAIGEPNLTLYHLKHGMISDLLEKGVSVDLILLMTRHTTRQMIENVYAGIRKKILTDHMNEIHVNA